MDAERTNSDAIERLNALIDGELPPAEHAALADRIAADRDLAEAHATLARLKACVVDSAEQTPPIAFVPPRRRSRWLPAAGIAAAAAAMLAVVVWSPERGAEPSAEMSIAPLVTRASLPVAPVIPDLNLAGLKLVAAEVERVGDTPVLVAAYRGPRGCRLELRVRPRETAMPATAGTSRRAWIAGPLAYELVAFGMPDGRFIAVAAAAEAVTRAGTPPHEADTLLRSASLRAPPCLG